MSKKLREIRLRAEYVLVYFIYIFLSILPINLVSRLGGFTFKIIGPFTKSHEIAIQNYLRIFPSSLNNESKKAVIKSWENIGKTFFELLILNKIVNKQNKKIIIEGEEHLKKFKENNEQLIFFGIHQSNWEILLPSIDSIGFKVGGIYRHLNNPYIDKLILNQRSKSVPTKKSFYTPKGRQSAKEITEAIKNKSSMVLLIDQKDSAGEMIKLFNFNVKTQIGFLKIARKYNMRIIPIENSRHGINNFKLKFYPPLTCFENNMSDNETMQTIHHIIEKWIRKNPSNWFLQHNRFN